jgi:peptidoglycan/LPS O-acetylase OafA/YrhL
VAKQPGVYFSPCIFSLAFTVSKAVCASPITRASAFLPCSSKPAAETEVSGSPQSFAAPRFDAVLAPSSGPLGGDSDGRYPSKFADWLDGRHVNRNPAFDGLRAVAVTLVMVHHGLMPLFPGGSLGVDLFFVLSGYLITGILLREAEDTGDIKVGRFLLKRALRLMPALILLIATISAIAPVVWPDINVSPDLASAGLYLSDYVGALYGGLPVLGHTWSLSVEEHFYLIWPIVVIALVRLPSSSRLGVLAAAFIVANLWRLINAYYSPSFEVTFFRFDTRVSGLILGALLATSRIQLSVGLANIIGLLSVALLIGLVAVFETSALYGATLQPFVDVAACGLVASLTSESGLARLLSRRPLVFIGLISYSIYLWHWPLVRIINTVTDDRFLTLAVTIPASIIIATLSYVLVEKPIRKWREERLAPA